LTPQLLPCPQTQRSTKHDIYRRGKLQLFQAVVIVDLELRGKKLTKKQQQNKKKQKQNATTEKRKKQEGKIK